MEENKKNRESQIKTTGSGTGVLSSIIFVIITFIIMYLLSKYLG